MNVYHQCILVLKSSGSDNYVQTLIMMLKKICFQTFCARVGGCVKGASFQYNDVTGAVVDSVSNTGLHLLAIMTRAGISHGIEF